MADTRRNNIDALEADVLSVLKGCQNKNLVKLASVKDDNFGTLIIEAGTLLNPPGFLFFGGNKNSLSDGEKLLLHSLVQLEENFNANQNINSLFALLTTQKDRDAKKKGHVNQVEPAKSIGNFDNHIETICEFVLDQTRLNNVDSLCEFLIDDGQRKKFNEAENEFFKNTKLKDIQFIVPDVIIENSERFFIQNLNSKQKVEFSNRKSGTAKKELRGQVFRDYLLQCKNENKELTIYEALEKYLEQELKNMIRMSFEMGHNKSIKNTPIFKDLNQYESFIFSLLHSNTMNQFKDSERMRGPINRNEANKARKNKYLPMFKQLIEEIFTIQQTISNPHYFPKEAEIAKRFNEIAPPPPLPPRNSNRSKV